MALDHQKLWIRWRSYVNVFEGNEIEILMYDVCVTNVSKYLKIANCKNYTVVFVFSPTE